jgi:hypothetical protein
MPTHRYDTIGRGYTTFRRPDPRIATQIWAAVGEADRIVNVGPVPARTNGPNAAWLRSSLQPSW